VNTFFPGYIRFMVESCFLTWPRSSGALPSIMPLVRLGRGE